MLSPGAFSWPFSSIPSEGSWSPQGTLKNPSTTATPSPQSPPLKRKWTPEEQKILVDWVRTHGTQSWRGITKVLVNRKFRECRQRWHSYHAEVSHRRWTPEEDARVIEYFKLYGPKWTKIAYFVVGRTANAIKNRWASVLCERLTSEPYHAKVRSLKEVARNAGTRTCPEDDGDPWMFWG
jgi:hypothetical protein